MRIISGKLKGSTLYINKNKDTRPLKDLVRESIFNLLKHSKKISFNFEKSYILDLYSGTGSFGLECLSRQAGKVFFVENNENAIKILQKNIKKLKLELKTELYVNDVFYIISKKNIFKKKFDLIFFDPPFKNKNISRLIEIIFYKNLLKKEGIIIIHRNKNSNDNLPNFLELIEERIYGKSKIIFARVLF